MNNETIESLRFLLEEGTITREDIERAFPQVKEDEDERIRKHLINCVTRTIKEADAFKEISEAKILARLEKQKPAEWSEEDEKMRQHIISDLREFRQFETDEELVSDYEDEISWLKSLRPLQKWRPNERQLSALLAVINEPNNAGAESCHFSLEELYWDLKLLF